MSFHLIALVSWTTFYLPISLSLQPELQFSTEEKLYVHPNDSNKGWHSNLNGGLAPEIPPSCLDTKNIPSLDPSSFNITFFLGHRLFYYSGGSRYGYMALARRLLGRDVRDRNELLMMCPTLFITEDPAIFSGYGAQIVSHCSPDSSCHITDNPSEYDGNLGVDPTSGYVTLTYYLLATDNESYGIFYLCLDGVIGDYEILTTRPFVPPELAQKFINIKNQLGFPNSELMLPDCTPPKENKPYPSPFQNYPASGIQNLGWSHHPNNGWSP